MSIRREDIEEAMFLRSWPHVFNPALAYLGCTLGLLNIDRFSTLSIQFGANFILQFLILSFFLGIPFLILQVCLGQRINTGVFNMWKISPLFQGVGIALLLVQAFIGIYSIVGVSWMLVYLRDAFIAKEEAYRWTKAMLLNEYNGNPLNNSTLNQIIDSVPDYFSRVVLQRQNLTKPHLATATFKFQVGYNLAVVWIIIFISLSKGLQSYGKVIYFYTLIPILTNLVLCAKILSLTPQGSFHENLSDIGLNEFFNNGKSWIAASSEAFFTWGLLGAAAMQIAAHNKHKHLLRRDTAFVIVSTLLVLLVNALIANSCMKILEDHGYLYEASSFDSEEEINGILENGRRQRSVNRMYMIPAYETTESEGETSNRRTEHWGKNNVNVETKFTVFNKKTTTPSGNIEGIKNNGVKVVKKVLKEIIVKETLQHLNCNITDKRPADDRCALESASSIKKKTVDVSKSMAPKVKILRDKEINTKQIISVPNTKPVRCLESTGLNPLSLLKRVSNDDDNNVSQSLQSAKVKIERLMKALKNAVDRARELKKEKESVLQELQKCKGDLKTAHEQIEAMFKEFDNIKHLNEEWQKIAINKCEVMHEKMATYKFLRYVGQRPTRICNSIEENMISHASFLIGQRIIHSHNYLLNVSGYQVLRFSTELVPSTIALLPTEQITPFWTILFYLTLTLFGISQQLAIWHCFTMGILSLIKKRKKGWETSITFITCVGAYSLGLPMASELGIYVIYYLDYVIGSSWWIMILYLTQFLAVFAIRGRPYTGETIVAELFPSTEKFLTWTAGSLLSFTWNILIPIMLGVLSVVVFKSDSVPELYLNHKMDKYYWTIWEKQLRITIQLVPILIIPGVAIIQTYRYLGRGSTDILERLQSLCRPSSEFSRPQNSQEDTGNMPSRRENEVFCSTAAFILEDLPPKYTPPPSYTTATGAKAAKLLRQSFRKSVRRVGNILRENNTCKSRSILPLSPPEYKP